MKKLFLLTIMTIMTMSFTACGTEQKATEEKAETISEYVYVTENAIESTEETTDELVNLLEEYYASEEYLQELEYNSMENEWY